LCWLVLVLALAHDSCRHTSWLLLLLLLLLAVAHEMSKCGRKPLLQLLLLSDRHLACCDRANT
jgi:hypothetical protein